MKWQFLDINQVINVNNAEKHKETPKSEPRVITQFTE